MEGLRQNNPLLNSSDSDVVDLCQEPGGTDCKYNRHLDAVHLQIQGLNKLLVSFESLDNIYEDETPGEKCSELQNEVMKLRDKLKTHFCNLSAKYKTPKAASEATRHDNEEIQKDLQDLQEKLPKGSALQEMSASKKKEQESMAENEAISGQIDALRHGIQEIKKDLQNEKALHKRSNEIEKSREAMRRQKNVLQRKLCALHREYNNVKTMSDLCQERRIRMDIYQRENDALQRQINDLIRQIQSIKSAKDKGNEKLKVEQKTMLAKRRLLTRKYAEAYRKLLDKDTCRYKYYTLKELTDALEEKNTTMTEETQVCKHNLKTQEASERNYKSLQAEKRGLIKSNIELHEKLSKLEKKLSKKQPLEVKITVLKAENKDLGKENCALQNQVNRLQDEHVLGARLKNEKDTSTRQNVMLVERFCKFWKN